MSASLRKNFVVFGKSQYMNCDSPQRKFGGGIGHLRCSDRNSIEIHPLDGVYTAKYPDTKQTCGSERYKRSDCDVIAPGCTNGGSIMIDEWTYLVKVDFP